MADFTYKVETTTRAVYALPSPTNTTEVAKVLAEITQDLQRRHLTYFDDTVTVQAWDDEIRFSFAIPNKKG